MTSIETVPLFVVESPRNTYWRQAAYATYTGTGWARPDTWQSIDRGVPGDERTVDASTMDYEVRLLQSTRSLPTAWQPKSVQVLGRNVTIEVSSQGGVRSSKPLPENATYHGLSSSPPRQPERLESAGQQYPDEIEREFARAPEATERVREFTRELTDTAETPYATAVTIRNWLQSNKAYSLNVSHTPGEPITDQFLFEMDAGFCQYFATSMATMLRTQGIPARYVVGYAPGNPVGSDRYLVTSDRAHAWVEVYFPDVGWVRFDPTPSGSLPIANPQPPYNITLNRSAVAGAPVSIAIEKTDDPVVGAAVRLNGERVGWTGRDGTVTTRLPYTRNVTISALPPGAIDKYDENADTQTSSVPSPGGFAGGSLTGPPASSRVYSLEVESSRIPKATNESTATFRSRINATVRVNDTIEVGDSGIVNVTIDGVPVRGLTVYLDQEEIGTTDGEGLLNFSTVDRGIGEHTVSVRRGDVVGNASFVIRSRTPTSTPAPTPTPTPTASPTPTATSTNSPTHTTTPTAGELNMSVKTDSILPLPAMPVRIDVTRGGVPVSGVTITLDGQRVGETGPNGTLSTRLPVADSVTINATGPNQMNARSTVSGLYRNALILSCAILLPALGLWLLARRYGITIRRLSRLVTTWVSRMGSNCLTIVLWVSSKILEFEASLRVAVQRLYKRVVSLAKDLAENGTDALRRLDLRGAVFGLYKWVRSLVKRGEKRIVRSGSQNDGASASNQAVVEDPPAPKLTLRELWAEFVALVRPPGRATLTPGEISRYAIDRGLPEGPVIKLRDLYRDVEYGGRSIEDSRVERAREALASIRGTEDEQ